MNAMQPADILAQFCKDLDRVAASLKRFDTPVLEVAVVELGSAEDGWPLSEFAFRALILEELSSREKQIDLAERLSLIKRSIDDLSNADGSHFHHKINLIVAAVRGLHREPELSGDPPDIPY